MLSRPWTRYDGSSLGNSDSLTGVPRPALHSYLGELRLRWEDYDNILFDGNKFDCFGNGWSS